MSLLEEHDVIIRRALASAGGREVKHTGDGVMASFDEAANALACALEIQSGFGARIAAGRKPECRVRIGLAAGEPVDHNDDLFGATVNLARRLCDVAEPGSILVSDVVYRAGAGAGFSFGKADTRALKGFSSPVSVYELVPSLPVAREGAPPPGGQGAGGRRGLVPRVRALLRRRSA